MTNFYEELKLERTASASEIAAELVRLESVWHKREMSRPELAAEKLALIVQAKKVFATDASKAQYDRELNAPKKESAPDDPNAARKAQFQKWYSDAINFYNAGQTDLAKTAIERAAGYGVDEDDADFYLKASQIYRNNGELSTALSNINRAIVNNQDEPEYYLEKAFVLEAQQNQAYQHRAENAAAILRQQRETLMQAADKAAIFRNNDARGRAYGMMAFSLYFGRQKDEAQAEEFAQEAVRLGDRWGNAQRVLDEISKKRDASDRAEREVQARRDALARQEREKKEAAERAERERLETIRRKKAKKRRTVLILLTLLVVGGLAALGMVRANLTNIGAHLNYRFDQSTGTLTISGKGETRDFPTDLVLGRGMNWAPWEQSRNSYSQICAILAPIGFDATDVRSLELDERITYIGSEIFNFPNLSGELTIPSGVRAIGSCAFENTGSLETIYLSNSIEAIKISAFTGKTTLVFDGTLEEWSQVGTHTHLGNGYAEDEPGGFNTRRAYAVYCTNGSITRDEELSTYYYGSSRTLVIQYDGTLEQFRATFGWIDPDDYNTGLVARVICADGVINLAEGETW